MNQITLILAEPHALIRAGFRKLFESVNGVDVMADVSDGRQLLDAVVSNPPQIVVSELSLPQVSGLEAAKRIVRHLPRVRFIFLSAQTDSMHVRSALRAGASGFLSKSSDPPELEIALRAVLRGQTYVTPSVSKNALDRRRAERGDDAVVLSQRQRQVLRLIGRGKSTKEIATLLGIGTKTVETHRARLMQSLGLRNGHALVHFAVRAGLDSVDER
jgi:DNA-binding NarL/FixJ family response regulator